MTKSASRQTIHRMFAWVFEHDSECLSGERIFRTGLLTVVGKSYMKHVLYATKHNL